MDNHDQQNPENMDLPTNVLYLKKTMLEAVKSDLDARAFEVPGSATSMISALAELLIFFSIGGKDEQSKLSNGEKEWWRGFCLALAQSVDKPD